jgi:hypothetical protein
MEHRAHDGRVFVGTGAAAIATGLTGSPITLALGLSAIGLFSSIGTALLIRNAANRGRALGWNGISGSIGLAVAPFVAGALAQMISWRAAFIVPGAPAESALLARYTPRGSAPPPTAPKLVATTYDRTWSFATLWLALGGCAGLVALAGLFLPGRLRRAPLLTAQPAE